jgi:gamma-glutamyl:cysteine ligase YbdK (ATP-grasp superfamily)
LLALALGGCGGSKMSTSVKTVTQVQTTGTTTANTAPGHLTEDQALAVIHAQKAILTAASACLDGRMTLDQKTGAANATNQLISMYDRLGPDASSEGSREPIVMRAALSQSAVDMRSCTSLEAQEQELHSALLSGR